ncbi:uncharacterized protein LOC116246443 [Nymphaea colorata]|nr:uncharacterized protein LOC116246443 [Nymphaea colorata]
MAISPGKSVILIWKLAVSFSVSVLLVALLWALLVASHEIGFWMARERASHRNRAMVNVHLFRCVGMVEEMAPTDLLSPPLLEKGSSHDLSRLRDHCTIGNENSSALRGGASLALSSMTRVNTYTVSFLDVYPVASGSAVTGLFIIGDSSVNCGDNVFLLPFLQTNATSSLCANADTPLVPDILYIFDKFSINNPDLVGLFLLYWTQVNHNFNFNKRRFRGHICPTETAPPPRVLSTSPCPVYVFFFVCNAAEKLGLPRVPPFYGMNRTTEGVISGLNFGSLTAGLLYSERFSLQGVNTQLRQALEAMQLLQISYGQDRARELASRSLFYISAGANDYLRLFLPNVSGVQRKFASTAFARFLVRQMSRVIKDLYGADVRKIICAGIPPLGCTPRLLWERYNSSGGISSSLMEGACVDDVNKQVLEFNVLLSSEIAKLQDELPGSKILFCDVYQGIMNIIREPRRILERQKRVLWGGAVWRQAGVQERWDGVQRPRNTSLVGLIQPNCSNKLAPRGVDVGRRTPEHLCPCQHPPLDIHVSISANSCGHLEV